MSRKVGNALDKPSFINECCWHPESGWSGKLSIGPSRIAGSLNAFESRKGFGGFDNQNIELILASGETATLIDCQRAGWGTRATATRSVANAELVPSYVLVGDRRWTDQDLVSTLEFCLPEAGASLSFGSHRETDVEGEDSETIVVSKTHLSRMEIGQIKMPDLTVTLSVQKSLSRATRDDVGKEPIWFKVEFAKPSAFHEIFQVPFNISTFFELSVGHPLRIRGFVVRAYRDAPLPSHIEHVDDFEFYRTEESQDLLRQYHEPIFSIWRDEDRKCTLAALQRWLERRGAWAVTYWLASQFVHGGRQVSRSNMLRAMSWFEAIPDYQLPDAVDAQCLKAFTRESKALESFKALGVSSERLKEVHNELRRVPLIRRMEAAIMQINEFMGTDFLSNSFLEACKKAKKLRDKSAHGGDDSLEREFHDVVIATSAIETLATISTIRSLGIDRRKIRLLTNMHCPHPYCSYLAMNGLEGKAK